MPNTVKLIAKNESLFTSHLDIVDEFAKKHYGDEPSILIYRYPAGDVDTISWPNPDEKQLRSCLFDARETGMIPDVSSVELPDGTIFQID